VQGLTCMDVQSTIRDVINRVKGMNPRHVFKGSSALYVGMQGSVSATIQRNSERS